MIIIWFLWIGKPIIWRTRVHLVAGVESKGVCVCVCVSSSLLSSQVETWISKWNMQTQFMQTLCMEPHTFSSQPNCNFKFHVFKLKLSSTFVGDNATRVAEPGRKLDTTAVLRAISQKNIRIYFRWHDVALDNKEHAMNSTECWCKVRRLQMSSVEDYKIVVDLFLFLALGHLVWLKCAWACKLPTNK